MLVYLTFISAVLISYLFTRLHADEVVLYPAYFRLFTLIFFLAAALITPILFFPLFVLIGFFEVSGKLSLVVIAYVCALVSVSSSPQALYFLSLSTLPLGAYLKNAFKQHTVS